nr:MAG TPA: hypothetical protein [Caudoviricetes sp.]
MLRRRYPYDAGIIIKLYPCNAIHEISHTHCSVSDMSSLFITHTISLSNIGGS